MPKTFENKFQGVAFGGRGVMRPEREKEMAVKPRIQRTSAGLRDALFDAIEKVRDGDMPPEEAKAISSLASNIVASVQLEINVAKLRTEYPADSKLVLPASLPLGPPEEEKK